MELTKIADIIKAEVPDVKLEVLENVQPGGLACVAEQLLKICDVLHKHSELYFDQLSCITAMDNGPEANTLEVIYNLSSIPYNYQLTLKVVLPRTEDPLPEIPTLSGIWMTANWHEREIFDLMGINFTGHPDMRRLFLPADWKGHPLRKDYKDLETYHGIKVKY
ncbi:MAG: NADH-quinone oxidoreductase subunit C [Candidatus Cyclobacteriaceae bacterium M2_1C_046]